MPEADRLTFEKEIKEKVFDKLDNEDGYLNKCIEKVEKKANSKFGPEAKNYNRGESNF